jgi:RNA polymerase sigma-70 factor, ECF subfamily
MPNDVLRTAAALDALARRAVDDPRARADLCAAAAGLVRAYFSSARYSIHDAEDATQQVILRLLEALPRYAPSAATPFRSWLFTIAHNVAVDRARAARHTARATAPEELIWTAESRMRRSADDVAPRRNSFRELLTPLTKVQQQVLTLIYVHDFSAEQVAAILDRTPSDVRQQCKRGLDRLRRPLGDLTQGPI